MRLAASTLRIAGTVGTLAVAGAAGVAVAADQRPASAPLTPPVGAGSGPTSPAAGPAAAVTIPPTAVCQPAPGVAAGAGSVGAASPAVTADPAVAAVVRQLRATPAGTARQAYLRQAMASLSADQRQQLTALLQRSAPATAGGRARGGGNPACRGGSPAGPPGGGDGGGGVAATVDPSVVEAPPGQAPVAVSAVS